MGCCISKCTPPKRKSCHNLSVEDKLVISQSPPSTPTSPPRKRKTIQSPPSTTSASFTCSTQSSTCGSSSLSTASSISSVGFSKVDRSFSNDFLQSCAIENPQIIGLDPIKKIVEVKQATTPGSTQKRARASSPNLTRQKSFRVEKERVLNTIGNGRNMTMRSPSPSRRFNGYTSNYQRQQMVYSTNTRNETNRMVKMSTRPPSPNRHVINKERPVYLKNKERFGYDVGSKVEDIQVGQVLSKVDYTGPIPMEDLDNPHIALDCFIFL
ncbi:hypothetical protein CTI12_AA014580 [Artemisia annua]|uniref:Uncharacterized protein n=1 Tax=Artemisia annua TaxID=35608 RepID=A0A2U1QLI5_ARTAN|nr:hypothetical protein CTI12_AA014580 [Artemisia annua]